MAVDSKVRLGGAAVATAHPPLAFGTTCCASAVRLACVWAQFRRLGVARALMSACGEAARAAGLSDIYLHVRQVRPPPTLRSASLRSAGQLLCLGARRWHAD